jgi:mRNA interferase MazF
MLRGSTCKGRRSPRRVSFSDLSQVKLRPAVILADAGRNDYVLCQVTSNSYGDPLAVTLAHTDFASGSLQRTSYARPGKLFTASGQLLKGTVGDLTPGALQRIVDATVRLLQHGG